MSTALLVLVRRCVPAAAPSLSTACDGFHAGHVAPGAHPTPQRKASTRPTRNATPAWHATRPNALAGASVKARAQALALACATQTDRLITASSRGDAAVASAIRDDIEFRARTFVLRTPIVN
jgi:hypothetical protein